MPENDLLYKGDQLKTKVTVKGRTLYPYLPNDELVKAVQLAQILQRPLLVKGEPGCGKSRLAEALAYELHGDNMEAFYFEWNVKSTSKAQDGLYSINNLQRLSDANFKRSRNNGDSDDSLDLKLYPNEDGTYQPRGQYIELGVLGQAFTLTNRAGLTIPPVILVDEIDKADIDFPNDLLVEIERMEFGIPEILNEKGTPLKIEANKKLRPIFIITSNDEKPLPNAFLRRCLFHYIDFKDIKLEEIVNARFPAMSAPTTLVPELVKEFTRWREELIKRGVSNKTISTSELLDWVELVNYHVTKNPGEKPALLVDERPSFYQALLKDVESLQVFTKKDSAQKDNG